MNALTNHRAAAAPAIPAFSPKLRNAVAIIAEPIRRYPGAGDDPGLIIAAGPVKADASTIEEARGALPAAQAAAAPASRETIRKWLMAVNGGVANPLDADAFTLRLNAILTICGDAPASVWSADTLRTGLARWKFAPSASEVAALIEVEAGPIRRQVEALRKLAEAGPDQPEGPPAPREAPTEEALRAVAEMTAKLKSDLSARRHANDPEANLRPTPLPRPDAALLADYEATARDPHQPAPLRGLAAIRAKVLRERLGLPPTA